MTSLGGAGVGETHGASRATLQGAVNGAGVVDEVESSPRISGEEFSWQEIALEAITAPARSDEIAGGMNAALGKRQDVIDGRDVEVERGGAVHTPPAAVTHHCMLDRTLLVGTWGAGSAFDTLATARGSRKTRKTDVVIVSTTRQFHLAEKATPRNGSRSRSGASRDA